MPYKSLQESVSDLEKNGHLLRIPQEVDPCLEMAEIHRRVFQAGGPAILFEKVKGSPFPAVSNLFGSRERASLLFRQTWPRVQKIFEAKGNPAAALKRPWKYLDVPLTAWTALPKKVANAPVLECTTTIDQLPQIKSWPADGGAFILLPQVYSEDPDKPGILRSNLGMYRVQLSGNEYEVNREVGLHYQLRRDIGIHHSRAQHRGEPLRVSIFVGGPPAHTFAAVMYLPEGLPEAALAGALAGRRFRYAVRDGWVISADADFCITGWIDPDQTKPEGPFGDHLGYYSLKHPFPVMRVSKVYHRKDAIWPFTIVGRPPQEDTVFGSLVQELGRPVLPREVPGVKAVHAVDASGVHPLLLAIGSERYAPYQKRKPRELLTHAHALLGYGPCALAKYLMIVSDEDNPALDIHDIPAFFQHFLERVDWQKDLHFQTATTMDTLDYSGTDMHEGSKLVLAAAGDRRRDLSEEVPAGLEFSEGFGKSRLIMPGVLAVEAPPFESYESAEPQINIFCESLEGLAENGIALILIVDDSQFTADTLNNFLWVAFTRSNPSHDIYGVNEETEFKHWGCRGPLVIDARIKPHHAPPLIEDEAVTRKVDQLAEPGGPLAGIIQPASIEKAPA